MLEGGRIFRIVLSPAGLPNFCHNFCPALVGFELSLQISLLMCSSTPIARYIWLFNNIPVNQCQVLRAPSVVCFSDNSLILCYSSCFRIVFPLW